MTQRVLLRRDAGLQRHAVDRARGHQTDQKKVRAVFHQIGQGEKSSSPPTQLSSSRARAAESRAAESRTSGP